MRAHNDGHLEALPFDPIPIGTAEVDLHLLAALFLLADVLDVSVATATSADRQEGDESRFPTLVTGWRYDDQGRIELHAVPKTWADEEAIATGYERMRHTIEPLAPTLQGADLPWELELRQSETELERQAEREITSQECVERAFVGMDYFTEADAPRFKGREDEAHTLRRRLTVEPLILLVGDSGVGKTSLIHAGLFPLLHRAGWRTVYARPFDDPDTYIVRALWCDLLGRDPPSGISLTNALAQASKELRDDKLLVVLDQFEDVTRVPLPEMLNGLRRAMIAVQARRFRNLRLLVSYRADAEAALGPLFQRAAGSDRGPSRFYLEPLDRAGARAALEAGFTKAQVGVSDALLEVIASDLEMQTPTPGVYPPYAQMLGETLCLAAREESEGILTDDLYRNKGGCATIVGRYLMQRLDEFGQDREPAERVLVALVRSTGVKGQCAREELRDKTRLESGRLSKVLSALVDQRMVRPLGSSLYEIVHDHLAQLVDEEIVDAEQRRVKQLDELLDLKARAYLTNPVLLTTAEMAELYTIREQLVPDNDHMRLLLHSCLGGKGPAWFWLQFTSRDRLLPLLYDAMTHPTPSLRRVAASIIAQLAGQEVIPYLRRMLKDEDRVVRRAAVQALSQMTEREYISDLRALLKDEDKAVRQAAVQTLSQVAGRESIPDLRVSLKDAAKTVREATTQELIRLAEQEDVPYLREMLKDKDWSVRRAAVRALAQVTGHDAISDLRAMLQDPHRDVRQAATQALTRVARQEAVPDLRALLRDRAKDVRQAATQALAEQAAQEAIPDLRVLLEDRHTEVQSAAIQALAQMAARETIPDLLAILKDQGRAVRRAVAQPLVQMIDQRDVPELRVLLKDEDGYVRQATVWMLAQVAGREGVSYLREMLEDKDQNVRGIAVQALAQVADRGVIPDLRVLLEDKSLYVRRTTARAIGQVAAREDISHLLELLRNKDSAVRTEGVRALAQVAGRDAISDLRALLRDEARDVRKAAMQTLAQVIGRGAIPDLRAMLEDEDRYIRQVAVQELAHVAGQDAVIDLQALLKDEDRYIRLATARTLQELATKKDLIWLAEGVASQPWADWAEAANKVLIYLDHKFYFPFGQDVKE